MSHIFEVLNNPESFGDWDNDLDLDVDGHKKKWTKILIEMIVIVLQIYYFIKGIETLLELWKYRNV